MKPPLGRHLVAVWNPSYAARAMEETLSVLLDYAGSIAAREAEEEVRVWWGKVRSPNRQAPLPHLREILAIDADLRREAGPGRKVHLYLTVYRSST